MSLADIIIPLCGSISNERAQKIREACDMQERRVEALEKRVEALSLDVAILVEGTVEAVHEAGLRTLAQRVEALEQIRISHEADYSKSASVLADRIEALDRALSAAAEDNGDLDVRVPALERASAKNTGEGHGVAGSTPAGPSRSTTMPSPASPASEIPAWVLLQHDAVSDIVEWVEERGGSLSGEQREELVRLVQACSRAPRPSPQPSVEQGYGSIFAACADRLAWARWSGPDGSARPCSDMEAIRAVHALLDDHDCWKALAEKRRKEIEAMKPKPQPSVEEMAERLLNAQLKHYGLSPRAWAQVDEEERAYWLALARAALAPTNTPAASGGRDGVE